MVYCGKPSKGCSNCRERKIRCDQRQPGCGQCEKRQRECPGYRNLVDLMFRDESSHVINKANANSRKKRSLPSPAASHTSTISDQVISSSASIAEPHGYQYAAIPLRQWSPVQSPPTRPVYGTKFDEKGREVSREGRRRSQPPVQVLAPLSYSLSPSFQERGVNLFFTRYISVSENLAHHRYDFILDLWQPNTSDPNHDGVLAGITAVGLVGVAEMSRSGEVLEAARKSYGKALRLTNDALRDPGEAVKDTTLLSVMLLGLFEMIGGSRARGIESWQKHLNGAAALARLRGVEQFRTPAGVRLLFMLAQNTMISCIQNELPMPEDLIEMRKQVGSMLQDRDPGFEVCSAIYKILQLRHDIKQGSVTDMEEMLDEFTGAESDFERAILLIPKAWQYRRCRLAQQPRPGFYNDVYHVYPDLRIARMWNGLRTLRLLVLETMLEELRKRYLHTPVGLVPKRHQREYQKAKFKMERIALAVLASVPQHFGLIDDLDEVEEPSPMPSSDDFWPQIPESDWAAELGSRNDRSNSDGTDDEDNCCRSPTLNNPMQAKDAEARAQRFILLSSVTNNAVWPLYLVGMSTASTDSMKAYAVERLRAIHAKIGLDQARELADVIMSHRQTTGMPGRRPEPSESMNFNGWNKQYVKKNQRTPVRPV
ncbi:White-opaque regulator 1 [Cytospora mali]|uniref:White-opaque regulator 1 n=1 Tax=Cytospora mali TaxID=578113 RepID=A0A194V9R2_CYTMA|nr:White-opaque regulator 1 [Valsa mali var. pyri (nom. inval.)]